MKPLWSPAEREEFRRETARRLLVAATATTLLPGTSVDQAAKMFLHNAVAMANMLCTKLEEES